MSWKLRIFKWLFPKSYYLIHRHSNCFIDEWYDDPKKYKSWRDFAAILAKDMQIGQFEGWEEKE